MKKLVIGFMVALTLVSLSACEKRGATNRVTAVLEGLKKGGASADGWAQQATARWWNGDASLDQDTLATANLKYVSWLGEQNLARKITAYEVGSAESVDSTTMIVSCTIEGKPYKMRVTKGVPIQWVKG